MASKASKAALIKLQKSRAELQRMLDSGMKHALEPESSKRIGYGITSVPQTDEDKRKYANAIAHYDSEIARVKEELGQT
jgi:hypothetical protein